MTGNKVIIPESVFDTSQVDALAAADTINLEAEFEVIQTFKRSMAELTKEIDEEIKKLVEYRASITQPYEEAIKFHTEDIENSVFRSARSFKCQYGKATYRRESERSSWDTKALLGYAAAHPEIEQFRKVTPVKAAVMISFEGDGQ
jgi:hypothetical protein